MPSDKPNYTKGYQDKPDANIESKDPYDTMTECPQSKDIESQTSTKPDGSQTKTNTRIEIKSGGSSIVSELVKTVTEISAVGDVVSQIVQNASPSASVPEQQSTDFCKDHPDIIACSKWGEPDTPDEIKTHDMDMSIEPGSSSVGSCPADKVLHLSFVDVPFSYSPVCQLAGYINPLMVAFSWLTAGFVWCC